MALLQIFQLSPRCPSDKGSIKLKTTMENWSYNTKNGIQKLSRNETVPEPSRTQASSHRLSRD